MEDDEAVYAVEGEAIMDEFEKAGVIDEAEEDEDDSEVEETVLSAEVGWPRQRLTMETHRLQWARPPNG